MAPLSSSLSLSLFPLAVSRTPLRSDHHYRRRLQLYCCLAVDGDSDLGRIKHAPPNPRIALAGGGTGGHIYPAIAIADEIRNAAPGAELLFLGSESGMEASAVPAAGYTFSPVPRIRLYRPVLLSPANLLLPFFLLRSIAVSFAILRRFRPDVVVGTGGYVAFPVCAAAFIAGIKIVIQEQNSFPGLTNRSLAPFAEKIFLAFNGCVKYFPKPKCLVYGNPIRLSLRRYTSKAVARSHFFPKIGDKAHIVLVLGGTVGASAINIAVLNMYYEMLLEHKDRYVIWQTGADGYPEMESLVKNNRRLLLTPFLDAMDMAYAAADVVVTRAGAMTCTEILTTGKPSVLIPQPDSADDHQTKNAYIMADIAGSRVLTEDELDSSSLVAAIDEILGFIISMN
ncbi:uncharacterized protein [Typha latifolia]|uniref:uncharacterized protein isoform X2 n=1 Tax=Typha latifolia TaxID=4733 RepID=UPI003C2DF9A0